METLNLILDVTAKSHALMYLAWIVIYWVYLARISLTWAAQVATRLPWLWLRQESPN